MPMQPQRGGGGIDPTHSQPRRQKGCGWSAPSSGRFTPGKHPAPIVQEAGWASGPAWTGTENLAPTGSRSPERPARSESLHRLSYAGRRIIHITPLCYVNLYLFEPIIFIARRNYIRYNSTIFLESSYPRVTIFFLQNYHTNCGLHNAITGFGLGSFVVW